MKWWQFCIIVVLLIACNLSFWIPAFRYKPETQPQPHYYIITWSDVDEQFVKMKQTVEILRGDLGKQGILSWTADSVLQELDKEWLRGAHGYE